MTKCSGCGWEYPSKLVAPVTIGTSKGVEKHILCGICALEKINKTHGVRRNTFTPGSLAEGKRLGALKWREEHSTNDHQH